HNPPEYNGYKVYWEDGAQVMPEIANAITDEINSIEDYSTIPTITDENKDLVVMLGEEQDTAFIEAVKIQSLGKEIIEKVGKDFKIVFTPLCGTGNTPIRRALKEVGFENVLIVPEEEVADPNFAGIEYPNPEEQKALTRGIELAKNSGSDLVIATDPDCDRVGVAVKTVSGDYALLTGNQIGGLLTNYIIEGLKEKNELKEDSVLIKTIVTSEFGADIAKANNVEVMNVLTGFKFIGEKIKSFEETNKNTYLFGYEESYGYLVGTHARDKDGVVASLLIAEMAAYYYSKGMSLYEGLQELYKKYGYFKEKTISMTLKGIEGLQKIQEIISYFRNSKIDSINDIKVVDLKDYQMGVDNLPKSNVLKYFLADESWIAIRPSGTEPKLKFYVAVKGENEEEANAKLEGIENSLNNMLANI
ncbi:MAG: phospho-sugar mutase, partial [Peptostreptococcaceae bacterium]